MKRVAPLLLLGLWACPADRPTPTDDVGATPITRTATIAPPPPPPPPVVKSNCPDGPTWIALSPCQRDGAVWAVGHVAMMNESLGRTAAGNRARLAVAEASGDLQQGQATLVGAEVPRSAKCGDTIYALAKLPKAGSALPACASDPLDGEREGGACPAWVERVAYREGDDLVGVGLVEGIKDRNLAEQTAFSRALANAQRALKVQLVVDGSALEANADVDGASFADLQKEPAHCGSITAIKVTVKAPR